MRLIICLIILSWVFWIGHTFTQKDGEYSQSEIDAVTHIALNAHANAIADIWGLTADDIAKPVNIYREVP